MIKTSKACLSLMMCLLTVQTHTAAVPADCNESGCYQACLGINCTKGGTCILGECACLGCIHEEFNVPVPAPELNASVSSYLNLSSWRIPCNETLCQGGCERNYCGVGRCNFWGCGCFDCNHTTESSW